jgi:DNA-directed RNA polymerase specialized sigma24 family protein
MNDPYRKLPLRLLLQRVAKARRDGDWRAARGEWEACVIRMRPRVELVVDDYVRRGLVPSSERDPLVWMAIERATRRLVENLEVLEEKTFIAAVATCADFTCRDAGRKHARKVRREVSIDATGTSADGDGFNYFDSLLKDVTEQLWLRGGEIREADERIDKAIARLGNERAKKLFTLQRLGIPDAEIARQLGVEIGNLYQIRSRSLRELRGLIDS